MDIRSFERSGAGAGVEEGDGAGLGGGGVGELPGGGGEAVFEEAVAAADEFGGEGDAEPVEFVGGEQIADDAAAGQDDDVAAGLVAELLDHGGGVGVDDPGVLPGRLGQGGREDDLLDLVQPLREGPVLRGRVLVVGDGGPEAAEALEVLPAEQGRGGGAGHPRHVVAGAFGDGVRHDPAHVVVAAGAVDPAVERERDVAGHGAGVLLVHLGGPSVGGTPSRRPLDHNPVGGPTLEHRPPGRISRHPWPTNWCWRKIVGQSDRISCCPGGAAVAGGTTVDERAGA